MFIYLLIYLLFFRPSQPCMPITEARILARNHFSLSNIVEELSRLPQQRLFVKPRDRSTVLLARMSRFHEYKKRHSIFIKVILYICVCVCVCVLCSLHSLSLSHHLPLPLSLPLSLSLSVSLCAFLCLHIYMSVCLCVCVCLCVSVCIVLSPL